MVKADRNEGLSPGYRLKPEERNKNIAKVLLDQVAASLSTEQRLNNIVIKV